LIAPTALGRRAFGARQISDYAVFLRGVNVGGVGSIALCAKRFPDARLLFLPPAWFGWFTLRAHWISPRCRIPPMPFSMPTTEAADLVNTCRASALLPHRARR
jgi:hypothetical protein